MFIFFRNLHKLKKTKTLNETQNKKS